jgi:hypothetical protein
MMRRILTLLVAGALAAGAAGCAGLPGSGDDSAEAASLLQQASTAMNDLKTAAFTLQVTGTAEGQTFGFTMNGRANLKGENQGDFELHGSMNLPMMPATNFDIVAVDGSLWMRMPGQGWQQAPAGLGGAALGQQLGQQLGGEGQSELQKQIQQKLANLDLTKFIKDVHVDKQTVFLGEPVTKISGTLDTRGLLSSVLGQLGPTSSELGGGISADQVLGALGDTHASLYISDTLHYLRAAHASLEIHAQGQKATIDLDFSIHDVNEPVEIKSPA